MPQSCYDCPFQHPCKNDEDKDYCVVIDDFLYCYNMEANNCPLIEISSADVATVVHGEWIPSEDDSKVFGCSECHEIVYGTPNYCPRCGAKMDLLN